MENNAENNEEEKVRCPKCGSSNISFQAIPKIVKKGKSVSGGYSSDGGGGSSSFCYGFLSPSQC
jgi:hypothetical protein